MLRLLLVLLLASPLAACGNGDDAASDTTIAIPTGEPLTGSEYALIVSSDFGTDTLALAMFNQQFAQFTRQIQQGNPALLSDSLSMREIRRLMSEQFVMQHLIEGLTEDEAATAEDSTEVANRIQAFRGQAGEEEFQNQLAQQGMTEEMFREMSLMRLRSERVQQRIADATPQPSEADVEAYRSEQAEEVRASQISFFLYPNYTPAQRDSVEQLAEAVLDSVQAGTPLSELAARYSNDPSGQAGGDVDFFNRSMGFPFTEEAFALADSGDVAAELVRTPNSLHVLQLTGRRMGVPMDTTRARQALRFERQAEAFRDAVIERFREANGIVRVNDALRIDLNDVYEIDG